MHIPFLPLADINRRYETQFQSVFSQKLQEGQFILGKSLAQFEEAFANYCGVQHCIGVGNGLDALYLIIKSLQLPPNSEIIVPANTFIAGLLAISRAGHIPVLAEPSLSNYLTDVANIERVITAKTRAILVTHLYGKCAAMNEIHALANQYQLLVLEDAAQAHGSEYQGKKAGSLGLAAGFSFYPTKNLGALGDAGCITTNDTALANAIKSLRNYGSIDKQTYIYQGVNSRMDELQAAFLSTKLQDLDAMNQRRRIIAYKYCQGIRHPQVILPPTDTLWQDAWHQFVVRCTARTHLRAYLTAKGIETSLHYAIPPHQQPAYAAYRTLHLPNTTHLTQEMVSLPIHPALSAEAVAYIIEAINAFVL